MNYFEQRRKELSRIGTRKQSKLVREPSVPVSIQEKIFFQCKTCGSSIPNAQFSDSLYICPHCSEYYRMNAPRRLRNLLDEDSFRELNPYLMSDNPLKFPGYAEKMAALHNKGVQEAVVTGTGKIKGQSVAIGVMDSRFFMASMGVAVGEKLTQLIELAMKKKLPLILVCASGGARMQEGIYSLMQMAKTSAAVQKHSKAGLLYISILTNPTTGGVTASFASLGDIILAEPKALIGFAGPRVIEQTIKQTLPEGFQRAEYLLEHGFIDHIVAREEMRDTLSLLLQFHNKSAKMEKRGK